MDKSTSRTRAHTRGDGQILHLRLRYCFYDKIESGKKRIEYREATDYWKSRLSVPTDRVVFHRGYTQDSMEFGVEKVTRGKVQGVDFFKIHLGKRIS